MEIRLSDISKKPCSDYYNYIIENYGINNYFNPIDVFNYMKSTHAEIYFDVFWLIKNCKLCNTLELIDYAKSLNPGYSKVSFLISSNEVCQTPEMVKYYFSLNPNKWDILWLKKATESKVVKIAIRKNLIRKRFKSILRVFAPFVSKLR